MATSDNAGVAGNAMATRDGVTASRETVARAWRWRLARDWALHWEFWLALALGAFLRLWHLDVTQFLDDQTGMMALARDGIVHGALPVTGLVSSIHTFNPPIAIYFLMPFAALTANPLPAVISIALWNVLGVALCYIFTLRYFGRVAAATSTLLFATCAATVNYSRFLWPQNYLPPLLLLWAFTLYAGCVRGRRGWLVPNVALLLAAILLHPTAAFLIPATAVGVLLAPHAPRLREYVGAAAVVLVLIVPTLLWEVVSHGYDLHILQSYAHQRSQIDLTVFAILFSALSGPGSSGITSTSHFVMLSPLYSFVTWGLMILIIVGYIILTILVFKPPVSLRHSNQAEELPGVRGWLGTLWRRLRTEASWRAYLLLWLWMTVPLVGLIRHSSNIYSHYLMVLYPVAFIVAGLSTRWLSSLRIRPRITGVSPISAPSRPPVARLVPVLAALLLVLVTLLTIGQTLRSAFYTASLAEGHFSAFSEYGTGYGYPLGELQSLDASLTALAHTQGATTTFISTPVGGRYRSSLDYMLARERADRVSLRDSCLLLPAPSSGPALEVAAGLDPPAGALLAQLPNAQQVAAVPLAGSTPLPVYRVQGATPALPGEHTVTPALFRDGHGDALRLDAALIKGDMLRLRWTVLAAPPATLPTGDAAQPWFRMQVGRQIPPLNTIVGLANFADCQPTRWQTGETLFTWLLLPTGSATGASADIFVRSGTQAPGISSLGPLRLIALRAADEPHSDMYVTQGQTALRGAPGAVAGIGAYVLPLGALSGASSP